MSVGQAMNFLTGPAGSGVKVAVIRRGKATPEEVDVVREKSVAVKMITQKADDTLVLRLKSLDAGRAEEVRAKSGGSRKAGHAQRDSGSARMRARPGFRGGIAVARFFVPSGTSPRCAGRLFHKQTFSAEPKQIVWKGSVSVLIDATTSGAAEVLASAIVVESARECRWRAHFRPRLRTENDYPGRRFGANPDHRELLQSLRQIDS